MTDQLERLKRALPDRYGIENELGAGGMATVYLADDLKHDRKVAIKVMRPELSAILGGERFLREVSIAAKLNHPHILALHDSGEAEEFLYYVMPYVEGESLREKLNREKQLSVDEAISITKQVGSALDYAHEHGVIHRDIKPENVLIHQGEALVADFGIALAVSAAGGTRLTDTGLSLGTPEYMSPEQATGERELDARSDVYSLGAITYEMLVGEPPHTGNTVQAIIAKVVSAEPQPVSRVRHSVPNNVDAAVMCALAKTPADRFDSGAVFAAAFDDPHFRSATPSAVAARPATWRSPLLWLAPWVVAGAAVLVAAIAILNRRDERRPVRAHIVLPNLGDETEFDLSPDGLTIAYRAADGQLQLRSLNDLEPRPVPGADDVSSPRFAPDGQSVAYYDGGLRRVATVGGPSVLLTDSAKPHLDWGDDGFIYFTHRDGPLARVPEGGGAIERLTVPDTSVEGSHWCIHALPEGRGVLFRSERWPNVRDEIAVLDLDTGEWRLLTRGVYAGYAASGHLVIRAAGGTVSAVPFDVGRLAMQGAPTPLVVQTARGFALSESGTLLYRPSSARSGLLVVDRNGTELWLPDEIAAGTSARIDPEGRRIAFQLTGAGGSDIWVYDLRDSTRLRLTFEEQNIYPTWTIDGEFVLYSSAPVDATGDEWTFYRKRADGTGEPERLLDGIGSQVEIVQTPDGGYVIRVGDVARAQSTDIYAVEAETGELRPVATGSFNERAPAVSPDGQWVAYVSDESGRGEVYVRALRGAGRRQLVSREGGLEPVWNSDGGVLFYRSASHLMAADILTAPTLSVGARRRVIPTGAYVLNSNHARFDIMPGGDAFLFEVRAALGDFVMVLNFFEELRQRVEEGND